MSNIPQIVTTGGTAGKGEAIVSGSGKLNQAITLLNSLNSRVQVTEGGLSILAGVPGAIDDIYSQLALTQDSISLVVSSAEVGKLSTDINGSVNTIPVTGTPITLSPGDFLYIPNADTPESPYEFEVGGSVDINAGATSIPIRPRGGSGNVTIEALANTPVILDGFTLLAKIEILRGEITSKVTQEQLDELGDLIGLLETQIIQNAQNITLKANQTTVDALSGRIDTAESLIDVNAEAITLLSQAGFSIPLGTLAVPASGTITQITLSDPIPINLTNGEKLKIYNEVDDITYTVTVNGNFAAEDNITVVAIQSFSVTAPSGSEVSLAGDAILSKIQLNANRINQSVSAERYDNDLKGTAAGVNTSSTNYTNVNTIALNTGGLIGVLYEGDVVDILPTGRSWNALAPNPGDLPSTRTLGSNPANGAATYPSGSTSLRFTSNVTINGPYVVRLRRRGAWGVISEINVAPSGILISGPKITLVGNTEFQSVQNSVTQALNNSNNALAQVATKLNIDFSNASGTTSINGGLIQSGTLLLTAFTSGVQSALVLKSGLIAAINDSTESTGFGPLTIMADKLNLSGYVLISQLGDKIQTNVTTIDGGKISASSEVRVGSVNNVAVLSGIDSTFRIWAGHGTATLAPFRVTQGGAVTANSVSLLRSENPGTGNYVLIDSQTADLTVFASSQTVSNVGGIHILSNSTNSSRFGITLHEHKQTSRQATRKYTIYHESSVANGGNGESLVFQYGSGGSNDMRLWAVQKPTDANVPAGSLEASSFAGSFIKTSGRFFRLQIADLATSDAMEITGSGTSPTTAGSINRYLVVRLNGTQYKIPLYAMS